MSAYVEFEFDLPGALLVRLIEVLDGLDRAPLTQHELAKIPEEQGVYQLFLDETLVYIGKTDAEAGLHKRLSRHARKILHRQGLDPARVSFKAIRVYVFTAVDLEGDLIKHYGGTRAIAWNGSGFGSNDPGRNRDTTQVKPENYDAIYPIDIDRDIPFAIQAGETAASALARLRSALPYTFRFEGGGRGRASADLETKMPHDIAGPMTTRSAITRVLGVLPAKWQATQLLGYVILYREAPRRYEQGEIIATGAAAI